MRIQPAKEEVGDCPTESREYSLIINDLFLLHCLWNLAYGSWPCFSTGIRSLLSTQYLSANLMSLIGLMLMIDHLYLIFEAAHKVLLHAISVIVHYYLCVFLI